MEEGLSVLCKLERVETAPGEIEFRPVVIGVKLFNAGIQFLLEHEIHLWELLCINSVRNYMRLLFGSHRSIHDVRILTQDWLARLDTDRRFRKVSRGEHREMRARAAAEERQERWRNSERRRGIKHLLHLLQSAPSRRVGVLDAEAEPFFEVDLLYRKCPVYFAAFDATRLQPFGAREVAGREAKKG